MHLPTFELRRHRAAVWLAACVASLGLGTSTAIAQERDGALAAVAMRQWADAYSRGRLGVKGEVRQGGGDGGFYLPTAERAGFVRQEDYGRLNHLDVLQKLAFYAEQFPSEEFADAALRVAGIGLDGEFLDPTSAMLRELGFWTLMRMDHRGAWFVVMRTAAGVPRADDTTPPDLGARIAALRLLGSKGEPVFASTIEGALADAEPRIRIAAAEAAATMRLSSALPLVLDALRFERHPVAAQALAQALIPLARAQEAQPGEELRERIVRAALGRFGQAGWRTDMDLLDLVEEFPHKVAVPLLIEALDIANRPPDRLVRTVNQKASPRRKQRVVELLRRTTGSLLAPEDVDGWRRFWRDEGPSLVVPPTLKRLDDGQTRAEFFGVPVTGGAIGFLIDTSGSMDNAVVGTGGRGRAAATRLDIAKEQLGVAVQAMDPEATFVLFSFADKAHGWTRTPIKAGSGALRALTELTGRMKADGGTDLFAGLVAALRMDRARFGEATPAEIDELFVLSDGLPTSGDVRDEDRMLELVRAANASARVRIHTVYTGRGDGAQLLR
ncbi:MAG: von Willebrand factor type domain, partial [Planctomycetota bacterium]